MTRLGARLRTSAVAALIAGYALLAHFSNSRSGAHALGVVVALAPMLTVLLLLLLRAGHRWSALVVAGLAAAAIARYWPVLNAHFPWIYLFEQLATYGSLAVFFGRSLLRGRVPLCTGWATLVHGPLQPPMAVYTRRVTAAWTLFFAVIFLVLTLLFFLAPLPVWSAFANFCVLPLVAIMFVGEYLARGWALPDMQHAGILTGLRAFLGADIQADALRRS